MKMGMFDIVWVPCPRCGERIEFQSKGGMCILHDYEFTDAPAEVLMDLNGDEWRCTKCCALVRVRIRGIKVIAEAEVVG